jgi:hypothetical protein
LAEKSRRWSSCTYGFDNPIRFIDPDGRDPGVIFKTKDATAHDFGICYNGASITENKEYGASIYAVTNKNGDVIGYSYSVPTQGSENEVYISSPLLGYKTEATIHSHGAYTGDGSDIFSTIDKANNNEKKVDGYITTQSGQLVKYDASSGLTSWIDPNSDLPSDKCDPHRANNIEPSNSPLDKPFQSTVMAQIGILLERIFEIF